MNINKHIITRIINWRGSSWPWSESFHNELIKCLSLNLINLDRLTLEEIIGELTNHSPINITVGRTALLHNILKLLNKPNNNELLNVINNLRLGAMNLKIDKERWILEAIGMLNRLSSQYGNQGTDREDL